MHLVKGGILLKLGQLDAAARLIRPTYAELMKRSEYVSFFKRMNVDFHFAELLVAEAKFEEAATILQTSIERVSKSAPKHVELRHSLKLYGQVLKQMGRLEEAQAVTQRIQELESQVKLMRTAILTDSDYKCPWADNAVRGHRSESNGKRQDSE